GQQRTVRRETNLPAGGRVMALVVETQQGTAGGCVPQVDAALHGCQHLAIRADDEGAQAVALHLAHSLAGGHVPQGAACRQRLALGRESRAQMAPSSTDDLPLLL